MPKLAAALAFYTAFSVAPILLIAIAVGGAIFGVDATRGAISREISGLVGARIGEGIDALLRTSWKPKTGVLATILGAIALVFGSSGVFGELRDSLNIIWKVPRKGGLGILDTIRTRLFSFVMVLGIGVLLLLSLVLSAGVSALGNTVAAGGAPGVLLWLLHHALPLLMSTALFSAAFKILPDTRIRWRDVWVGGFLTAALFTVGKVLIGLYLGRSAAGSIYGATGSFVLTLLWIYYSSQIFFFGAEFTKTWTDTHRLPPMPDAEAP